MATIAEVLEEKKEQYFMVTCPGCKNKIHRNDARVNNFCNECFEKKTKFDKHGNYRTLK